MEIKASRQPQPKRLQQFNFDILKKQCLKDRRQNNSSVHSLRSQKNSQYLQINYLKDFVYKVSPQVHSKVPLLREEQNFRDYLLEIQTDEQRLHHVNNQVKDKYFGKHKNYKFSRQSNQNKQGIKIQNKRLEDKKQRQHDIYLFDPIEYLDEKKRKSQKRKIKKLQQIHSFADDIQSVKYLSQAPQIKLPKTLPLLDRNSTSSFFSQQQQKNLQKAQSKISNSINQILQKSIKLQSESKQKPKKMRSYKSRSQLQKQTQNKMKTQRKSIIKMISSSEKSNNQPKTNKNQNLSLNQIDPKQKYGIDYISYVRTKTKDQLGKYAYERFIKKPEKDLQKFQQFMLKEVKFQNQENKHKIERFFIKMREEFRRIEKYNKKGSKLDWRSKSMHLDEIKKQEDNLKQSKILEQKFNKIFPHSNNHTSKFNTTFLQKLQSKRLKSKVDRIMAEYIHERNEKQRQLTEQLFRKQQQRIKNQNKEKQKNQEMISS